jgi:hypothetical protein
VRGSPASADPALVTRILGLMEARYGRRPSPEEIAKVDSVAFRFHPETAFTWTLAEFPRSVSRWRLGA